MRKRLRDEREAQDGHPRVEAQASLGAKRAGHPVLGVDRDAEVGSDGPAGERDDHHGDHDEERAHSHILAYPDGANAPRTANSQVAGYR